MATAVGVMDAPGLAANMDVLVVVDEDPDQEAVSGPALDELGRVDSSFVPGTFAESAVQRTIAGKTVLVR